MVPAGRSGTGARVLARPEDLFLPEESTPVDEPS